MVRLCREHCNDRVEIYVGERRVRSIQGEMDRLRDQCGQSSDLLTSAQVFLALSLKMRYLPVAVVLRRGGALYGAVLLNNRTLLGVPTGILTAGYICGRGATIAAAGQHSSVAEVAARVLLRTVLAHTVVVRLLEGHDATSVVAAVQTPKVDFGWSQRQSLSCIDLSSGLEHVMSRFSYKMRRNIRYYRRRAERDLQCNFMADLSTTQSRQAVEALNGAVKYRRPLARALQYRARLAAVEGNFAMGLQDHDGNWLSFIAGWREKQATYIEWQLNREEQESASLSTVMRAYCLEHEIGRGAQQMIFVGGTNQAWRQACEPQQLYQLSAVRKGVHRYAVQALGKRLRPNGVIAEVYADSA